MFTYPGNEAPARPGALYLGTMAGLFGLAAAGLEGYFWIRVYNTLTGMLPEDVSSYDEAQQSLTIYNTFLVVIVVISVLISLAVAIGAVIALRGSNGGRITMWIAGGVAIAWHLCCSGYTLLIRAVFAQAAAEANADGSSGNDFNIEEHFPIWLVDAAIISGFAVGVASIVAVVAISLSPVNRWYRALRTPVNPYQPPNGPGRW